MKWKLEVKKIGVTVFSVFYVIVGCLLLAYVVLSSFRAPPTVGVLGFLSLVTAYGLIKMRKWSVILVIALFFIGTTFGATELYPSIARQTLNLNIEIMMFNLALIVYLIVMLAATIYIVTKRRKLFEV